MIGKRSVTAVGKLLLLEDDSALGNGISLALQAPGLEIRLCRTLAQARQAVAGERFDLLILM